MLKLEQTENTPKIYFNSKIGYFEISGISKPKDAISFYKPIIEYLDDYSESPKDISIFNFDLKFYDDNSTKMILEILSILEEMVDNNMNMKINWNYEKNYI